MSERIYQTIQVVPVDDILPIIEELQKKHSTPEVMNTRQLAAYLGVSESTIRNRMKNGLPFSDKLADPRFLKLEVDRWFRESK